MTFGRSLRRLWALDEDMIFLNHGAYGATPRELFAAQDQWRARMEAQPVRFFMNDLPDLVRGAAADIATFVKADAARTVLLENVTSGISAVLRSLRLVPGDRIVTTSHVYNAVRNAIRFVVDRSGAVLVEAPVPMPVDGTVDVARIVEQAIDDRTRIVVIDHIASPSAVRFPVEAIVQVCHDRGVPVLVDGAHAPGMIEIDVDKVGADWYVGNGHKWLCAPKGLAFLVVSAASPEIHPLAISHAYGAGLLAEFGKIGTRDPSPWLCARDTIDFHHRLGGADMRRRNAKLAVDAATWVAGELDTEIGGSTDRFGAMVTVRLPGDLPATQEAAGRIRDRLWHDHRIEALVVVLDGQHWLRLSVHAYNERADFDTVPSAVHASLRAEGVSAGKQAVPVC